MRQTAFFQVVLLSLFDGEENSEEEVREKSESAGSLVPNMKFKT